MATTEETDENRLMKLNPALDVDLDEIDDKEFDIPRVDKPPTLESILNAPDEDLPIADNCIVDGTLQVGDTPTTMLCTLYACPYSYCQPQTVYFYRPPAAPLVHKVHVLILLSFAVNVIWFMSFPRLVR